ncbi:MAG: amidase [Acidobacteria bacterium RIFCSPLOWO2_02_FULL_68_18]|nr:MAG: amidase [Acidobacteria bacterium RIFCSPLOWO2_02_FULL_68_18]OFW49361.1 MAG: amidase [Acidobacteria bacterium RIFCSPLOWO2_12_FULL_68_19]
MRKPNRADELCDLSAIDLAALIRRKEVSAREVMAAHLARIERVNPKVNAIVTLVADRALADAARADEQAVRGGPLGVLHGLPVAHKDLVDTAGIRTTRGSPFYRDRVPTRDALVVTRIRAAGAITCGKTNTPEFGAGSQTFNTVFGATRNPYDAAKTCGGSSGGAAVALACGMVPIADGSDTGGSLRNPAAFCNVVGLRPSPGRVPTDSASWSPLSVSGPMARSVADVALFLSAIAGYDARSPLALTGDSARFRASLERGFKGVRVAWWRTLGGIPVEPEIRRIVDGNRRVFESLGCLVEEAEPDFTGVEQAFPALRHAANHPQYAALLGQNPEWVKDTIKYEVEQAERLTGADIGRALARQAQMYEQSRQFFERYDYFVLPVTQVAPFDVDVPYPTEIAGTPMTSYIDWMRSCWYVTFMATPAISVPAGFTAAGLPVGIQIVGRHRDEWSVLQIAHAFEQATRHRRRRPFG